MAQFCRVALKSESKTCRVKSSEISEIWYKISGEGEASPQSNDIRSTGRMRLELLMGSLFLVSAIMAKAFNPALWVRSIQLRRSM